MPKIKIFYFDNSKHKNKVPKDLDRNEIILLVMNIITTILFGLLACRQDTKLVIRVLEGVCALFYGLCGLLRFMKLISKSEE